MCAYDSGVIAMERISVRQIFDYDDAQVPALYESVGWSAYIRDPENLRKGMLNSLCVYGAFAGEQLVGLTRAVGDGVTIVFIQDILVQPAYQRRGIGRALIASVLEQFQNVRQILQRVLHLIIGVYVYQYKFRQHPYF